MSHGIINLLALLLAVVWMLRNEKDKSRPILVFALVLNLLYSCAFYLVMVQENALVPWRFDHVLIDLDHALGVTTAGIARPLQGAWRLPLLCIYQMILPMMIVWYFVGRSAQMGGSVVLAYAAELVAGLPLYAIVPACGPVYAFPRTWLHPPAVPPELIRLTGMPNAFPSLHVGTAVIFVFFARGRISRAVSLSMLGATVLATLSTGEHYIIDLVPGFVFGCFAAAAGHRRFRPALFYLATLLTWSLSVRFGYTWLITHASLLRLLYLTTFIVVIQAIRMEWMGATRETAVAKIVLNGEPAGT